MRDVIARADLISGWMSKDELIWLYQRASLAKRIVEVGCHEGRSTFALMSATDGSVYAVDIWTDPDVQARFVQNMGPALSRKVHPVRMASVDASSAVPGEFDLIFIDGDHSYDMVMLDLCAWTPRLRPGGIICGHDYDAFWPGVVRAVDEVFGTEVRRGAGSIWFVRTKGGADEALHESS
jgi:predicted O-methyltransferase YrrM